MTDPNPVTPDPSEPAAAPEASATAGSEATATHPSWDRALQGIPEPWQAPIRAEIANQEREFQKAIEKARSESTPEEWRALIAQAQQAGLDPDALIDAYNGGIDFRTAMEEDPDKFLADLGSFIDREVAAGNITRKQAAAAKAEAQAIVDDDEFATPESKELKELRERLDRQDAEREQEAERQRQDAALRQVEQQAQAYGESFMRDFDQALIDEGFIAQGSDGKWQAVVPVAMHKQIALNADAMLDAQPNLTPRQAIDAAIKEARETLTQMGAQLPQRGGGSRAPQVPVMGATSTAAAPSAPADETPDERRERIIRTMQEMTGQG